VVVVSWFGSTVFFVSSLCLLCVDQFTLNEYHSLSNSADAEDLELFYLLAAFDRGTLFEIIMEKRQYRFWHASDLLTVM